MKSLKLIQKSMNDIRNGPKSGIQACTGSSRGHPPELVGASGHQSGLYAARGDPPVAGGARGHPPLSFEPGVDSPERFKARDHPEILIGARGHPEMFNARNHPEPVNNIGINSSEEGLIISTLACFSKPDGRGMPGREAEKRLRDAGYGMRVTSYGMRVFIRQPADRPINGVRSGDADRLEGIQKKQTCKNNKMIMPKA